MLVLAPTRELACQILDETQKFGRPNGIRSICCYGGSPKYPQIAALERGVECVIATPGRINDLIEMKKADLSGVRFVVLDEADRMVRWFVFSFFLLCSLGLTLQLTSLTYLYIIINQNSTYSLIWDLVSVYSMSINLLDYTKLTHSFILLYFYRTPNPFNYGQCTRLDETSNVTILGYLA